MLTRGSVLGKRGHPTPTNKQLATPEPTPNPKRPRTSIGPDDDSNKENIVPPDCINYTPRSARALRRAATEILTPVTPPRARPATRRNASVGAIVETTPTTEEPEEDTVITPPSTPPVALLPLHVRVRALLRPTCNDEQKEIAGRDEERAAITEFFTTFVEGTTGDDAATSMFISGPPGTGKTALVNAIIRQVLGTDATDVKVLTINCMALKSVDALWERLTEEFSAGLKKKSTARKAKGRDAVTNILGGLTSKYILVLDELDHITPDPQSLSSVFSLPQDASSNIRLVAIANTHTLTSASPSGASPQSSTVQTIHFAPYTPAQLQVILDSRLSSISDEEVVAEIKKLLPAPVLTLLTKKVAGLTGDVRSLFEILRGAIDLAVTPSTKASASESNPLNPPAPKVTPQHILAALKAHTASNSASAAAPPATQTNSETVNKIRNLGLQARMALLAILLASNRVEAGLALNGTSNSSPKKASASPMKRSASLPSTSTTKSTVGIETSGLHSYYCAVLSRVESGLFDPVSRVEFGDLLGVLEGVGIVSLSSSRVGSSSPSPKGKRAFSRSASFGAGLSKNGAGAVGEVRLVEGTWADEILRGLGVTDSAPSSSADDASVDVCEEEVRGIWEREKARLARDVKAFALAASSSSSVDAFAGAFEA
ncbi:hypothetical protein D9619_011723 [Psilocybe cf. subviscida]|uniref:AAA+ ATPase domain-containing protein n=1 Tax=Psilocybe cf. subviscida TaxID=2480587 RepID=A0A8H5BT70_9AGAR|nr:hypothetical protein D9619_011723 [Psilocybe cf. subviscida]